jgi:signal transduction histidine kinase
VTDYVATDFGDLLAERIRAAHELIAARWLERLSALLPVDANEVFSGQELLDHIPALIRELAEYVRTPEQDGVAANTSILVKARELGELRYAQRASVHQLLQEYRLLGAVLLAFVREEVARLHLPPSAPETLDALARLHEAVGVLLQTTVDTFVAAYADTIARQTARLESFSRMVSHELRQPLSTVQYALHLLQKNPGAGETERLRLIDTANRNVGRLSELTRQLEVICRLAEPVQTPQVQEIDPANVAREVARQLREMADARGVQIFIPESLPMLRVDVARLELLLVNLLSNAIKYSDPHKVERSVRVSGGTVGEAGYPIEVRDNGIGIDAVHLASIFSRFYRAHPERDRELGAHGSGLGLFIAQECVTALGGTIDVESNPGVGTTFRCVLPVA